MWSREGFEKVLRNMCSMSQILSENGDKWNTLTQSNSPIRYRFFEHCPVFFCEDDLDITRLHKYVMLHGHIIKQTITLEDTDS